MHERGIFQYVPQMNTSVFKNWASDAAVITIYLHLIPADMLKHSMMVAVSYLIDILFSDTAQIQCETFQ